MCVFCLWFVLILSLTHSCLTLSCSLSASLARATIRYISCVCFFFQSEDFHRTWISIFTYTKTQLILRNPFTTLYSLALRRNIQNELFFFFCRFYCVFIMYYYSVRSRGDVRGIEGNTIRMCMTFGHTHRHTFILSHTHTHMDSCSTCTESISNCSPKKIDLWLFHFTMFHFEISFLTYFFKLFFSVFNSNRSTKLNDLKKKKKIIIEKSTHWLKKSKKISNFISLKKLTKRVFTFWFCETRISLISSFYCFV